jgi:uncharacterized coiled-coil protein SlyX
MSYQSSRKKNFPCLRCNIHVKKTERAVQCALCDLWVHKDCEGMSDETFSVLDTQNEEEGRCFWTCKSCHSYALKFDKRMRNVETRVAKIENETIPEISEKMSGMRTELDDLKGVTKNLQESSKKDDSSIHATITSAVLEEMKERETRRCNLIVHNIAEPGADVVQSKDRVEKDIEKLQELLGQIEVEVNVNETFRFAKRLGARDEGDDTPRPLLIGFKERRYCDSILDKSHKLSDKEEPWSSVNIIRDLTKAQRKEEKEMRGEVERRIMSWMKKKRKTGNGRSSDAEENGK